MKPRIDRTSSGSFSIWESGAWKERDGIGRACIVAGPDGEKLDVIFDTNPANNNFHYLFFANVGQVVATAFIRDKGPKFHYDLELKRIINLTTEQVQDRQVPRATYETLWVLKTAGDRSVDEINQSYHAGRPGYRDEYRSLILTAVSKAFCPPEHQRLFWGNARTPRD